MLARLSYEWQQDVERRLESREQALAIAHHYENQADIAYCFWRLGELHNGKRNYAEALPFLEQSLVHYQNIEDRFYIGKVLDEFGIAYRQMGQLETALRFQQQGLAVRRAIHDYRGVGWCLYDMSITLYGMGRATEAATSLEEALDLWRSLNDRFGIRSAGEILGYLVLLRGDFERARTLSEELLKIAIDLRVQRFGASPAFTLALLASLEGNYRKAQQLCQQGLDLTNQYMRFDLHWGLALAAYGLGDYQTAQQLSVQSISLWPKGGFDEFAIFPIAAIILSLESDPVRAVELLGSAFNHPDDVTRWLQTWPLMTRLRAELETRLGVDAYADAWALGAASSLEAMTALLRQHFRADDVSQPASQKANRALVEPLSERELEVLRLIAQGLSNAEIAEQLVVGVSTVKKHINRLYGKLGVQTRTQALIRAREWELV